MHWQYISLGTIFNNEPSFFKQCFEAFGESNYQVVLSRGKYVDAATLSPIPDNFLVSPYVPQLDILSRARVFVTHAGMNSTMESLYYGVLMVAVPQMQEQTVTVAQNFARFYLSKIFRGDNIESFLTFDVKMLTKLLYIMYNINEIPFLLHVIPF